MSQFFTLLTKTGQGLLANAIAYGQPLTIATMAIGDGGGKLPTPDASVTRLINEVRRGPINQTSVDANNPNWTVVEQVLPPDVGGWTIREVGLFDTDGNLIAYGNYPETYKPQLSEGSSRTQTIRFIMEVTDTSAVTLRIDPSVVMASREYVDKSIEAHAKSRNHPYATTTQQGMTELATGTEARGRADKTRVLTPDTGGQMLAEHEQAGQAHKAGQIALDKLLDVFGDAKTVQAVLAMLGDAARKTVGEAKGNVMLVEAFGLGATSAVDRDITGDTLPTGFYNSTSFSGGSFYASAGAIMQARRASDRAFALYGICNDTNDARVYAMKQNQNGWVQNEIVTTASMGLVFEAGSNTNGSYIKLSNGIMWCSHYGAASGNRVSFPASFKSGSRPNVVATPSYASAEARSVTTWNEDATGFRAQVWYADGNASGVGANWQAFGYWK